jgi:hypothetical protein
LVTNIIASLALALSALSLFLQWRTARASLRVSVDLADALLPSENRVGVILNAKLPAVTVVMTNRSQRPVHVSRTDLEAPGIQPLPLAPFNRAYGVGLPSPFTVEPLRSHTLAMDRDRLASILRDDGCSGRVRARVAVHDEAGQIHRSRRFVLAV